jgi:hypothetical protein
MKQESNDQDYFERPNNRIGRHEMSPVRKGDSIIVKKDHPINGAMHDQEADEEQPRKRHGNFLSNGADEKIVQPTHEESVSGEDNRTVSI